MRIDYNPKHTVLHMVPEDDDERFLLETMYRERMALVNDSKVMINGDLQKLVFRVYVKK